MTSGEREESAARRNDSPSSMRALGGLRADVLGFPAAARVDIIAFALV
jgi:hypothetical protein